MEKGLKDSNPDETVGDDTVNQDSKNLNDIHIALLVENQEKGGKKREEFNQTTEENKGSLHQLQNYVFDDVIPQVSVPTSNLTSHDSQVEMSTYEPANITDESFELLENLPNRAVSTKQFKTVTDDSETVPPQNSFNNEIQSPKKDDKLKDPQTISKSKENYSGKGKVAENPKYRYKKESKSDSPVKKMPSQDESVNQSTECGALELIGSQLSKVDVTIVSPGVKRKKSTDERSSSSSSEIGPYDSKISRKLKADDGEKATKQCRTMETHQTRLTNEPSTMEARSQFTLVKHSEEHCASNEKNLDSLSDKNEETRFLPEVKHNKLVNDEDSFQFMSKFSEIGTDDGNELKITKKLKTGDWENASKQRSTIAKLPLTSKPEASVLEVPTQDTPVIISHTKFPSSTGPSKASSYSSRKNSSHCREIKCSEKEESSLTSGNEIECSEREEISLASGSDTKCSEREEISVAGGSDTKCSERKEISLARGSDTKYSEREETSPTRGNDKMCGEREESSLTTRSYERQESSHSSASFCVPCSEIEESPITSGSEDGMFREREVSSLTNSNISVELPRSELRDSYMTNTCDLSELIASISNEKYDSSHYISQSQIDQSHNERVNLNLPSSSGLTNVNTPLSNKEDLSNKSVQKDVTCRKKEQLSLRSRIDDEMCCEKESSLTSGSYCMTCSEREESSESDDFMFSDREDSTLTLRESFLSTVSDLSEQISNTREDASSSASEEL